MSMNPTHGSKGGDASSSSTRTGARSHSRNGAGASSSRNRSKATTKQSGNRAGASASASAAGDGSVVRSSGSEASESEEEEQSLPLYVIVTDKMIENAQSEAKTAKVSLESVLSGFVDEQVRRRRHEAQDPLAVVVVVTLDMQKVAEKQARRKERRANRSWSKQSQAEQQRLINDELESMIRLEAAKAAEKAAKAQLETNIGNRKFICSPHSPLIHRFVPLHRPSSNSPECSWTVP
jgi:hypothetical protein